MIVISAAKVIVASARRARDAALQVQTQRASLGRPKRETLEDGRKGLQESPLVRRGRRRRARVEPGAENAEGGRRRHLWPHQQPAEGQSVGG